MSLPNIIVGRFDVFHETLAAHVATIRSLFERLRPHSLKLAPPNPANGATEAEFLGAHHLSRRCSVEWCGKAFALTKMPMPNDIKQLRALLGGLSCSRKFLPQMTKCVRPPPTFLKNEWFEFTDIHGIRRSATLPSLQLRQFWCAQTGIQSLKGRGILASIATRAAWVWWNS